MNTTDFIAGLKSKDDAQRAAALNNATLVGPTAVQPAAALLSDTNTEVRRAAKRALDAIVHHAGRPNASGAANAVEQELLPALKAATSAQARRDLLWLLSEIGATASVQIAATLLANPEVRDDARCTLQRIPGSASVKALKAAFAKAPEDFKYALADSLRRRGDKVKDYPSQRLNPAKTTKPGPVGS